MQLESVFAEQSKAQGENEEESRRIKASTMVLMLFRLGRERFASPIDSVREVVDAVPIVPYPETRHRHLGVINLRGSIVPMVDLRPEEEGTDRTRFIIFEDEAGHPFGVRADEVWKTETAEDVHVGGSMLRIKGELVRLLNRQDLVEITEDNDA